MDEQLIFATHSTCTVGNLHSSTQTNLKQCTTEYDNGICLVGNKHLFVCQAKKALINVYDIGGESKRESVEQRLPLPEVLSCLEVAGTYDQAPNRSLPEFCMPHLLIGSTPTGKLYVWELNSGRLLKVKPMAHYQPITKIKSIINGTYIVTSGADARVMIWQTIDLVTQEDPKPVCILHDHTLPVTDFCVSDAHSSYLSGKLYTVSQDMTLRCYELDPSRLKNPRILATFTFSSSLTCIAADAADRACYVGTTDGVFSLQFFYKLEAQKVASLLTSAESAIYSCVESHEHAKKNDLFKMNQIVCDRLTKGTPSALASSMDGTLLVVGDKTGKCTVIDVYSRQSVKEIQPLVSQETAGAVTSLILCMPMDTQKYTGVMFQGKNGTATKIPNLQKHVSGTEGLHDIVHQVGEPRDDIIPVLRDFDGFLHQVASQEGVFRQLGGVTSEVRYIEPQMAESPAAASTYMGTQVTSDSGAEVDQLKNTVSQLTDAYQELREMHEKLYREHEELLEKTT
ncbi:LAMI_0H00364g1_1 [Lachancea mirantina]|uniref:Pre-rRNA-processing protein IPI3 n=1 Tax=Lachancea mirantina TaxID=1230905 RepID=A0A1G4KDG1_9SACH|nr:LAMI_0H00364g1_1 [Lachancea mirantina]